MAMALRMAQSCRRSFGDQPLPGDTVIARITRLDCPVGWTHLRDTRDGMWVARIWMHSLDELPAYTAEVYVYYHPTPPEAFAS